MISLMTVFKKVKNSFVNHGVRKTIFKFYIIITDFFFDIKYGINTSTWSKLDDLTIKGNNKKRGVIYQPTRVIPLRKLFSEIEPMIPKDSVFVDFGCGKGRVLLIASQFCFREVRGIEFAHELCEIAKQNGVAYKHKTAVKTEIKIIESDVVDYVINSDENVFFMFNPFDDVVLDKILNNIVASLKTNPRKLLIIYYNPKYGNVIEQQANFVKSSLFVFYGYNFTVYTNTD